MGLYDIALDPTTGDIALPNRTGRSEVVVFDGVDKVRQQIWLNLSTFLGEWFLDTTFGVPYFTSILVKNPSGAKIRSILRAAILSVPDVASIIQLDLVINSLTRQLGVRFAVYTNLPRTTTPGELVSLPIAVWGQTTWGGSVWGPLGTPGNGTGSSGGSSGTPSGQPTTGVYDSSKWDNATWA